MSFPRFIRPWLLAAGALLGAACYGQTVERGNLPEGLRERLATMSPEEKQQLREQVKAQWQQMSPAERASLREKVQALQNLSPEDRQKLRKDLLQAIDAGRSPGQQAPADQAR